ncbi:rap guanine nucleotide exchange factor 6 isoform X4 [Nasonia vitripennis]|uniref:Rap guanine nucleotide exchange factor 2 n=3 Tax=Chalcidoidea TaxID=7422 RepID=A0A7M7T949_NASVI|nr:rap guanine nucleotide exchange factor 6 isoform X4 [Nasonia vitripennis]XP_031783845.1 rap guanine nucleotide exchange factor 6 isoform X4 [Nasonia vitripennis]
MTEYLDPHFIRALCRDPERRTLQDLQFIYYGLLGLEALRPCRDSVLRGLCKTVRYERHHANHVLYYTGELATSWYILLSGSVFIDGSMFLPRSSFGKRTGGSARRPNECFVLEPSEMIAIDYPEVHSRMHRPPQAHPISDHRPVNLVFEDTFSQGLTGRPELYQKSNRSSHSSDTSSAYSGSDTMTSVQSSLDQDPDEVDLSGLQESVVDSDEEEDLAESMDSLTVRDTVRECLEKDPGERTEDDIEVLLDFTQHLKAFTNMTLAVRRALCAVMVFAVVERAGMVVLTDGEELDSWSVLINGTVEVEHNGTVDQLHVGDSFGILPTMETLLHRGIMRTKCDDCQFVCVTQVDYYRIQHQGEENTRRHEEDGRVILVTELRGALDGGARRGHVVIRGTSDRLMLQLIEENSITDPTYVEDFLLTHRTFVDNSQFVANQLLEWFEQAQVRDRVARVVLLWVNNHFTDFETDPMMMEFLEKFEACLEKEKMLGQQRLLNIACAAKARTRNVVLARPSRDEVLHFSILGGYEKKYGIFISKVEKKSKAEDVGLKRGDQILEVNGQSFEHVNHAKALEILRGSTHLSITVKSNLLAFKEMLAKPDNSPRQRSRPSKPEILPRLQTDPRIRLSTHVDPLTPVNPLNPMVGGVPLLIPADSSNVSPCKDAKKEHKGFMTLGPRKRFQKALMKMNILPKNMINDGVHADDPLGPPHTPPGTGLSQQSSNLYHSRSNPDLTSLYCYDEPRAPDYPEHVLKVYKADQTCKYLLVHKETTAHEVVMLALQEFGITESSSNFSLAEVSVGEGGMIKQRRLPDQLQNLAERIGLSSRYYLKTNGISETLVADEQAPDLVRESQVHFLQLNAIEVAAQLTFQDFNIFRQIESTEYVDDLFELKSKYGVPMLSQFAELVNREMFWVVTEVCSEHNIVRRSKIIKQFIKIARQCKECKNFNSMFAIVSGLGHGAVSRLRASWEKLPSKYQRLFSDLQELMDPSRNMSKYRQLVASEQTQPPIIPFYPVVKKDLTFIHLGNDSRVEGLVNFEKLRMIAKEVRTLTNMCSSAYDLQTMLERGGQPSSSAMVALNQMTTGNNQGGQTATVKRRKKSAAAPNPKKMFEEAQMVRRVKAYLANIKVISDEEKLHQLSVECEPHVGAVAMAAAVPLGGSRGRRHPSPTLSTTSSASSTSEGRKSIQGSDWTVRPINRNINMIGTKFGAASPQAVRKMLALSDPHKTRPYQPKHCAAPLPVPGLALHSSALEQSPGAPRRVGSGSNRVPMHERSHSDTPSGLPPPVDLSAESSSVTSLSNLQPLRKTLTSGSVTSSDSGHSTQLDSHSGSSVEAGGSPPPPQRRHSAMQGSVGQFARAAPPFPHAVAVLPPLPNHHHQHQLKHRENDHHYHHHHHYHHPPPPPPPPLPPSRQRHQPVNPLNGGAVSSAGMSSMPPPPLPPPLGRRLPGHECRVPPDYKIAAQMARLHRLGRAHSHEGVTYRNEHEDDDEDAQVSAV